MNNVQLVENDFAKRKNQKKAKHLSRFFKTGPGEYAEGDMFFGITVPETRKLVQHYKDVLTIDDVAQLLKSPFHELRLFALLVLVYHYKQADDKTRTLLYRLYLDHTAYINNWDLVDLSAEHIVGAYLEDKVKEPLYVLARSKYLWERRIAMLATFHSIKSGDSDVALAIAEVLLYDSHDLIHKAVGWMLREVGKRVSVAAEEGFLETYAATMPRTTLRYAIEHFPKAKREYYIKKKSEKRSSYKLFLA